VPASAARPAGGGAGGLGGGGPTPDDSAAATLVGFARTLRAAGVDASTDRVLEALRALDVLDPGRRDDVYWAGRLVFCASHDDVERYDAAFAAYFAGARPAVRRRPRRQQRTVVPMPLADPDADEPPDDGEGTRRPAAASRTEVLRERDIARLTPAERAELHRLLAAFALPGEVRPSRRLGPARRGHVDRSRTVRELLRRGGEPARLRFSTQRERPRRVVLLVDVSGSMSAYADALLRFAHAASRRPAPTEVFTVGTRLTRVTEALAHRDPERAMAGVAEAVPDWRGGTRLGELLKVFLDRWGQRGMARGAVVVMLSDGWERGDVTLLEEQMARLARLAHRVVWANPRKGQTGYQPLAAGMAAALPYCDAFVAGHSLGALEQLAAVVRNSAAPRRTRGAGRRTQVNA
jgi:uncharacterized protein